MYLCDRDLRYAIESGQLIVDPPREYDTTLIDLHLDPVSTATVWGAEAFRTTFLHTGHDRATLNVGKFNYRQFSAQYTIAVPVDPSLPVYRTGNSVIVRHGGFLLWQTLEQVGTPLVDPRYICFVDGKSTRARTGLLVQMTAPTIHAGWFGDVTLDIANLGPFNLELEEHTSIAQLTVSTISSRPTNVKQTVGIDVGQSNVWGVADTQRHV